MDDCELNHSVFGHLFLQNLAFRANRELCHGSITA